MFSHALNYIVKNKHYVFFLFLAYERLRTILRLYFFKYSPNMFSWWVIYSFSVIFSYKRFNFCYFVWRFLFLHDLAWLLQCTESIYLFYWWDLLLCFLFIQSGEYLYDPLHLKFNLWYLWYNKWMQLKIKSLTVIDDSIHIWYVFRSDSESSSITYSNSCWITNHDFYAIIFWMHYMRFIIVFRRSKINCYC